MMIMKKALARRAFLRGVGTGLALPLLDAMVPALSAIDKTSAKGVRRLGFVYLPNGVAMNFKGVNYWRPLGEGTQFEFSPILKPLESFRQSMVVFSGLTHHQADVLDDGANGDHTRGTSSWLTGVHPKHTEGADVRNGISADQIAAQQFGKETMLPSLELGIDVTYLAGNCENGYSCAYMNTLSWSSPTAPLPSENNPRIVFERLFGDGGTSSARVSQAREDRSVLDSVTAELGRLLSTLGPGDRSTMNDYVDSVREVERRIQSAERNAATLQLPELTQPTGIPERFDEYVNVMFDMVALAFQTDITRVVTFMLGRELNFRTYPEIGITEGHHGLSHHGDDPAKLARYAKLGTYQAELFSRFLNKLRSTGDGDGSLLDRSLLLYGAGLSNPNLHAHMDLPLLVVGGGVKGGRHVRYPLETPMTNLLLGMLDKSGVPADTLGDSTGRIDVEPISSI
jgi:uncharacterized protein DUF1552